jgi:hypothetical protein
MLVGQRLVEVSSDLFPVQNIKDGTVFSVSLPQHPGPLLLTIEKGITLTFSFISDTGKFVK